MSFGIDSIGKYIPENKKTVEEILSYHSTPSRIAKVYRRLFGLNTVTVSPSGQTLEDSLDLAFQDLPVESRYQKPDLVLFAHCLLPQASSQDNFIHRLVLKWFGDSSIDILGVSHMNCVSLISAFQIAHRYFSYHSTAKRVLVLACDQLNLLGDENRFLPGSSIMGDAAIAILLSRESIKNRLLSQVVLHDTQFCEGLYADEESFRKFYEAHDAMLDRAISIALSQAKISLDKVDWIFPHNMNRAVWSRFSERTNFPKCRIGNSLLEETGHTYTVDPFLNWNREISYEESGKVLLLLTVGIGSFVGAMVVRT